MGCGAHTRQHEKPPANGSDSEVYVNKVVSFLEEKVYLIPRLIVRIFVIIKKKNANISTSTVFYVLILT